MGRRTAIQLKIERSKSGLKQSEVAYLLELDRSYISKFERDKSTPNMEQATKLCLIYGTPPPIIAAGDVPELTRQLTDRLQMMLTDKPTEPLQQLRERLAALTALYDR